MPLADSPWRDQALIVDGTRLDRAIREHATASELEARLAGAAAATGGPNVVAGPSTGTSDLRHYVSAGVPACSTARGWATEPIAETSTPIWRTSRVW